MWILNPRSHTGICPRSSGHQLRLLCTPAGIGLSCRRRHLTCPELLIRAADRRQVQASATESKQEDRPTASPEQDGKGSKENRNATKDRPGPNPDGSFNLDDFNPLSMGRRSRRIFDDVWSQFAKLATPMGSRTDEELSLSELVGTPGQFDTPQAPTTRVLVVGATGRIGRVLARKLLLRGYAVNALVRDAESHGLPQSVTIFKGDVSDYASCRRALEGVDKVVYCAGARTNLLGDLRNVAEDGVQLVASAFQDAKNQAANAGKVRAARFATAKVSIASKGSFDAWEVTGLEAVEEEGWGMGSGQQQKVKKWARPKKQQNHATASVNHRKSLVFQGVLLTRGSHASVGCDLPAGQGRPLLAGCEGLTLRVASDGLPYTLELTTEQGYTYSARFSCSDNFTNVRLPFNSFRPERSAPATMDPADVTHIAIRRDFRSPDTMLGKFGRGNGKALTNSSAPGAFHLEVLRIKALPGGAESDFVLVSCAGKLSGDNVVGGQTSADRSTAVKRAGEACLRRTGLGYTIVRPAELKEEPGGYKAMLFDQGNRIETSISCVDVADICMRALHNPAARNKTFEVAHEAPTPIAIGRYELVAHLPDKSNDYLGSALASLEKNL